MSCAVLSDGCAAVGAITGEGAEAVSGGVSCCGGGSCGITEDGAEGADVLDARGLTVAGDVEEGVDRGAGEGLIRDEIAVMEMTIRVGVGIDSPVGYGDFDHYIAVGAGEGCGGTVGFEV